MKKLISILLCFVLLLTLLCGCNRIPLTGNLLEFETEEDMEKHLQGIWKSDDFEAEYYIISGDKYNSFNEKSIIGIMEDYFADVMLESNEDFENLSAETTLDHVNFEITYNTDIDRIHYNIEETTINIDVGSEFAKECYITDEGLEVVDRETGIVDGHYKKISDTPVINEKLFGALFTTTKSNYELPLDKAILSVPEIEEAFRKLHPEINDYILVSDDKETQNRIYTDSGSLDSNYYDKVFIANNERILFSTHNGEKKYTYLYTDKQVTINNNLHSMALIDILSDALIFVSRYPKALTAEQLLKDFEANATIKSGNKDYTETIGFIKYRIVQSIYTGGCNVIISTIK